MQPESGCLFNCCLFSVWFFGNYFHTCYETQTQHSLLPPPTTNPSPPLITAATHRERPPWAKRRVGPTSAAKLRHVPRLSNNGYTATTCHVTTTEMTTPTPNSEVLAVPPLFLQESGHSGGIPVDSGGMKFSRRLC